MPAFIPFRSFAALCVAAYDIQASAVGAYARFGETDQRMSGFQGAIYRAANGGGLDWVVAVAGTQPTDTGGADLVADAGFGGGLSTIVSPLVALAGTAVLWHQIACAEDLVRNARAVMGRGDRLYITGHSLGGGIAQCVAARMGVDAVGISAPAVTRVTGVESAYLRNRPRITCLKVRNDPINHTGMVGNWLGRVVPLESPRTGGDAHSIDQTLAELKPAGSFSTLGARDPFAA
ncbi:hypothetical protein [Roseomonas sp. HF4]|uniref:hypothetical protein n=1 Tax=Roseomonas sp. HF4 TaxID=2562313 RepID=UPI0010C07403|nr:hypothetical protein [Roseomonas sp. HF4]